NTTSLKRTEIVCTVKLDTSILGLQDGQSTLGLSPLPLCKRQPMQRKATKRTLDISLNASGDLGRVSRGTPNTVPRSKRSSSNSFTSAEGKALGDTFALFSGTLASPSSEWRRTPRCWTIYSSTERNLPGASTSSRRETSAQQLSDPFSRRQRDT